MREGNYDAFRTVTRFLDKKSDVIIKHMGIYS